ncbi:MAG: hypothetical protein LBD30_07615 [Verrucomicrobiales bacterium]|nr:hypothetical protein [Verrucomicrobiales bacterium]
MNKSIVFLFPLALAACATPPQPEPERVTIVNSAVRSAFERGQFANVRNAEELTQYTLNPYEDPNDQNIRFNSGSSHSLTPRLRQPHPRAAERHLAKPTRHSGIFIISSVVFPRQ